MISDKLQNDMKDAMKAGDKARLSVIRMLRSELKNAQIAKNDELTEEDEQKVLASYAKKRNEARQEYKKAGREDLADKEKYEYDVTKSYLPAQLSEEEVASIVKAKIAETGAAGPADFGKVMKAVMAEVGSRAEGATVSAAVKKQLSG
jgi:uncharacterized protein YqeY